MQTRKPLRKRWHPVLKAALWGAALATALSLFMAAAALLSRWDAPDLLFVLTRPAYVLEEAMGFRPTLNNWVELYLLPFAVNATLGALVFALPAALLETVDYSTKPPPR